MIVARISDTQNVVVLLLQQLDELPLHRDVFEELHPMVRDHSVGVPRLGVSKRISSDKTYLEKKYFSWVLYLHIETNRKEEKRMVYMYVFGHLDKKRKKPT
jgi:hypothetical protein